MVFLAGVALLVWWIADSFRAPPSGATTGASASPASTNNPPPETPPVAVAAVPSPLSEAVRQKLLGRWQRTDAEYAIEIRVVGDDGTAEARYFNPFNQRSINVARASVTEQGDQAGFFMELRDVGYPGSTYTLRYDPAADQLTGVYYQAAMQQNYEVVFRRLRE